MGDGTQKLGWVRGTALGVAVLGAVFLLISGIPSYVWIRFQNPDATILASRFEIHWLARIKKTREIDRVLRAILDEHPALSSLRPSPTGYPGRVSDIVLFEDGTLQHVVFVHGWGDCPSGCIHTECFCFVHDTTTGEVAEDRNHDLEDPCPRRALHVTEPAGQLSGRKRSASLPGPYPHWFFYRIYIVRGAGSRSAP